MVRTLTVQLLAAVSTFSFAMSSRASTVAYWNFEEGSAGSPATTVIDSSGNGNNGAAVNGPTYSTDVMYSVLPGTGQPDLLSLDFNGTNQRIAIPDSPSLALTGSMTIEALIKPESLQTDEAGQIVFRGDDTLGYDPYYLAVTNGDIYFHIANSTGQAADVSAPLPALNQWLAVAATLDNATGIMDLYFNGNLVATTTTSVRPYEALNPSENPGVGIGNVQSANYSEYFDGLIDEVRISDQALSSNQFLAVPAPAAFSSGAVLLAGLGLTRRRKAH